MRRRICKSLPIELTWQERNIHCFVERGTKQAALPFYIRSVGIVRNGDRDHEDKFRVKGSMDSLGDPRSALLGTDYRPCLHSDLQMSSNCLTEAALPYGHTGCSADIKQRSSLLFLCEDSELSSARGRRSFVSAERKWRWRSWLSVRATLHGQFADILSTRTDPLGAYSARPSENGVPETSWSLGQCRRRRCCGRYLSVGHRRPL